MDWRTTERQESAGVHGMKGLEQSVFYWEYAFPLDGLAHPTVQTLDGVDGEIGRRTSSGYLKNVESSGQ